MVVHAHGVELDRDAPLALQVHRVEHLLAHQALVQGARELDEAVGEGRFPVVDMGHDTEVADVILAHVGLKYSHPSQPVCYGPRMTENAVYSERNSPGS